MGLGSPACGVAALCNSLETGRFLRMNTLSVQGPWDGKGGNFPAFRHLGMENHRAGTS